MQEAKILINGKAHGLFFGYTCNKLFIAGCVKFKNTYQTEDGSITSLGLANLVYAAYLNNCYRSNNDPILNIDDINEWMDSELLTTEGSARLSGFMELWAQSKYIAGLVEEKKSQSQNENLNPEETQTLETSTT